MGCGSGIHGDSDYTITTLEEFNEMIQELTVFPISYVQRITFNNFYSSPTDFTPSNINNLNHAMNDFNNLQLTICTLNFNNSFNGSGVDDTLAMTQINYFSNDITIEDKVMVNDSFIGISNQKLLSVKGDVTEIDIFGSFKSFFINDSLFSDISSVSDIITINDSFTSFGNNNNESITVFSSLETGNNIYLENSFITFNIESLFNNCQTINNSLTIRNSINSCNLSALFNNLTDITGSLTLYNSFNTYSNDAINIIDNSSLSEKYDYILNTLVIGGGGSSPKFEKIDSIGSNLTIQYSLGNGSLEVNDFSNLQTIGGDFNLKALINSKVLNNNFDKLREIGGNLEIVTAVINCNNNLIFSDLESVGKKITIKDLSFLKNGQSRGNNMFPSLNNIGDSEMEIRDSFINMTNNFGPSASNLKTIDDLVIYNSFKSYGPNDSAAVFNSDLFTGVNDITNLTITNSFMNFNDQSMFSSLNDVDTFTIISNDLIEPYGDDVTTNDSFTNYEITTSIFTELQNDEINNRNFPAYLVAVPPFPLTN